MDEHHRNDDPATHPDPAAPAEDVGEQVAETVDQTGTEPHTEQGAEKSTEGARRGTPCPPTITRAPRTTVPPNPTYR
ncbi:hypothetical protein GCM10025865_29430 [Paraoerskovia sediminicola]|uniref:Uncharacterized protein n=1 Tax=Paraoerskovia sediminicola TaxID=1138587 RepID=A0ABN6XFS7_9CELL|nr:hypothetical protein [Paraoerskovia sediminicola]BDZ43644.1 hypothetical protein GCM10025865_29430 [Paraoerskovia sediminicola]